MKYMGSKNRIAKHLLPIILKDRKPGQWYVEPMVGGGNMIDKVDGPRIGSDLNPHLIEALKLIRDDPRSLPDSVSEDEWVELKLTQNLDGVTGAVGHYCSFSGRWFSSYAKDKRGDDYAQQGKRNAIKQSPKLKGALFVNSSYRYLDIPPGSIIYCDPPYKNTAGYEGGFCHDTFWEWVRGKSREGHRVFVSEYSAPEDFDCLWQGQINCNLSKTLKATEKLFIYSHQDLI